MEDDVKTLGDYLSIAWRRKFHILIPFFVVLFITISTVFLLPPVYKSTATILIESQQIPEALVQSAVTTFADERIQVIKQRIMTSQQLYSIIHKFDLYKDEINSTPRSEILDDMRNRISIELVSANLKSRRRGASAVFAFTIAFEHRSAATSQKVANELVTLFLDENIRTRTARAEETSEFLKKESERLGAQITAMDEQIASYKQENEGSLPESLRLNLERVVTLKSMLLNSESELNALNERKQLLLIDLETLQFNIDAGGGLSQEQLQQKQELQNLQNRYISLTARYGLEHPDVKTLQRQIDAFEKEYGNLSDIDELQVQQRAVKQEIRELTKKYSSEHPDVKQLERKLEGIAAMLVKSENYDVKAASDGSNPQLLQVKARLESVDSSIARISKARIDLEKQIVELDNRINRTPQVERGLDALERDYENTRAKYRELKSKQLQAELSQSLEEDQKGERFTLLEPPTLPDTPDKPDRLKLSLLGLFFALFCGGGVATLAEMLNGGIWGSRALASVTRMTPLVAIPNIITRKDEELRKRNFKIAFGALAGVFITFVISVHLFYKPLDLLWFIVLRKLNLT